MRPDIYVTGLGIISPAGISVQETWQNLLAGRRFVTSWSVGGQHGLPDNLPVAPVPRFAPPAGMEKTDRPAQLAAVAALQVSDLLRSCAPWNTLLSISTSKCSADAARQNSENRLEDLTAGSARGFMPFFQPSATHATVAACATGTLTVIRGAQMIADGDVDLAVCGGTDASIHPLWMACYARMGVLGNSHPELGPAWACRPFDRTRSGFGVGEGAATLVLESDRAVRARGTRPLARLLGYATGTDPAGLTQLTPDGEPLRRVIEAACHDAGVQPADLVCIHAHGTGTPANDVVEARAIRAAIGPAAARVPVVSTKGAVGHMLGAAGAVELALAVLTCREGQCPGNVTLCEPDPEMSGICLPRESFEVPRGPVLKTSLGFGGHLAAVVLGPV